ncbi:MAG: OmpA family protein [Pseudomonadota bacterium]
MKSFLKTSTAVTAIALLAGCQNMVSGEISNSPFGAATATNTLSQVVSLEGQLLNDLQDRFRQAAPDMVNFGFNESSLDAEAQAILDRQAAFIQSNPAIKFRIFGHADRVGSNAYNQALGLRRARTTVNYLVSRGVRRDQLEAVASFGETRPLVNTQSRERLNRRTVTEVFGIDRRFANGDFDGKRADSIYNDDYLGVAGGAAQ